MSKYQFRENRLGKVMSEPGGLLVNEALLAARVNVAGVREELLAEIDAQMAKLQELAAQAASDPTVRRAIYDSANAIVGTAGAAELGELGLAAFSLCELVDRLEQRGAWSVDAVAVHLATMVQMRDPSPEARALWRKTSQGLAEVIRKTCG